MSKLYLPAVPNSPLSRPDDEHPLGPVELRLNEPLQFIENAAFDPNVATYDANYQNSQAYSQAFLDHMRHVAQIVSDACPNGGVAVEVGCGKGDFLQLLSVKSSFRCYGYDATYDGDDPRIEKRYLTSRDRIAADIVILRHVLEHIHRPHEFLQMLHTVFGDTLIYIEVPLSDWIFANEAFYDVTYEHVNYFSHRALSALFDWPDLRWGECFGGQYQYLVGNLGHLSREFGSMYSGANWRNVNFEECFASISDKIDSLERCLTPGRRLYVWGAATKGCMFLAHCASRNKLIDRVQFAVDQNPHKCGKYLPASLVPIKGPSDFFHTANQNDVLLISNPNYRDEIIAQLREHGLGGLDIFCL